MNRPAGKGAGQGWTLPPALGCCLLALGLSACGARPDAAPGCQRDDQCPTGNACAGDVCIPRATPSGTWAVELLPRSDSTAAPTEFAAITLDTGPLRLAARAKTTITGTLGAGSPLNSGAHLLLSLPPEIPGRADLQFEGDWPASVDGGPPSFALSVPESVLGKTATLKVMPAAPDDHKQAPVSLQVLLAPTLSIVLPSDALTVHGRLLSAIGDPEAGFVARAFQGNELISTVFETQSDGAFTLSIPPGNITADGRPIFVELAPKDDKAPKPRFRSQNFLLPMNLALGDLRLPAYSQPNVFRFEVRGETESGQPISEAIVRARTLIDEDDLTGSAIFLRDGRTDAEGAADISLLPGSANALRSYNITVIPPPNSPYGVKCLTDFPLAAGGTPTGPALAKKIALPRKPVLSGTIVRADGVPVSGVTIMATRTETDPSALCADAAASPPANVTTDKNGAYRLLLDPGTYRIEYDPPGGAPVPRLTETGVKVAGDIARTVQMQQAAMIEGSIFGPDGTGLPSASIRLLEVACGERVPCWGTDRVEPLLRGQTRADAKGNFRLVIPLMTR